MIRRIHQLDTTYRPFHSEQRIDLCSLNNISVLPNNTAYSVKSIRRTDLHKGPITAYSVKFKNASYPTDLLSSENPERLFRLKKRIFETPGLVKSSSLELDLFSDIEEHSEEETIEFMTETMEQYISKTHGNYGSSEHEDVNEHIEKVLEIIDIFHIPEVTQDQVILRAFPISLIGAASRWLRNEPSGLITNWETLKTKFLNKYCPLAHAAKKMDEINNFQQEPDECLF
ncbi:retrovirus-related pol polyprotein from transposon TNT 1-94 [Tanacetum coccineum]